MTIRLPLTLLATGALATGAAIIASDRSDAARSLPEVEQQANNARAREQVLTGDISKLNTQIRAVETRLAPVQARWEALNAELTALRARRIELTEKLDAETERLQKLLAALKRQRQQLGERISAAYRAGEPTTLQLLLEADSLSELAAVKDNLDRVTAQDKTLIISTRDNANETRALRASTLATRREVLDNEERVGKAEAEARQAFAVIAAERDRIASTLSVRRNLLASVQADRRELEAEARGLRARSARLANQIVSGSSGLPSSVAVRGSGQLAWPVNGSITSPFGPRWGRMHEGIDVAASAGTPIAASAAGTVIVAGWSGGYGQLVVVSHGTISTAYAHMSRIAVRNGQQVSRGTVLGAVGCTGHCFGDHLHFEVRINGSPVNPVLYL